MKNHETAEEDNNQAGLTEKQRRVLDLLIENKTSKEIGRALGISPYTVDQRISLARGKLGVSSRNELAARYRGMRKASGQSASEALAGAEGKQSQAPHPPGTDRSSTLAPKAASIPRRAWQDADLTASTIWDREGNPCPTADKIDYRVGPEVFEGRSAGLWRIGAIAATALLLVMTILVLFAIFDQLNDVLA